MQRQFSRHNWELALRAELQHVEDKVLVQLIEATQEEDGEEFLHWMLQVTNRTAA